MVGAGVAEAQAPAANATATSGSRAARRIVLLEKFIRIFLLLVWVGPIVDRM
jgi:hypothetical protein